MKRMRLNGGARDKLRPEGLLVLGHQDNDPAVARALSLPVPTKGQFVVCRVVPSKHSAGAEIEGSWWRPATADDPVVPAPVVHRSVATAEFLKEPWPVSSVVVSDPVLPGMPTGATGT